jgi:molybdopterin-guanine dinucleotide biosynthesis protein B
MPLILSIVGFSNSGKTTLLREMIPLLKTKGYSVGVVKHTDHDFSFDRPGKDTFKFKESGADNVALVGADLLGFRGKLDESDPLFLDRLAQTFYPNQDILLIEGFKKSEKPKIVVLSQGKEVDLFKELKGPIIATVGTRPVRNDVPHFNPDDHEGLVNSIIERFLKERKKPSIQVILDGKRIPMKHFVHEMVRKAIWGLLSPLKGFKEPRNIEIMMSMENKERS